MSIENTYIGYDATTEEFDAFKMERRTRIDQAVRFAEEERRNK